MASDQPSIYCIDSSTLMNFEDKFPEDIFLGIWDDLSELVSQERLFSHREVYEEIKKGSGFLVDWADKHRPIFLEHNVQQALHVKRVVNAFKNLSGAGKTAANEADAWLIALSLCANKSWVIVTDESPKPEKRKIPVACDHFGVPWVNGYQLLRQEKWQYVRVR